MVEAFVAFEWDWVDCSSCDVHRTFLHRSQPDSHHKIQLNFYSEPMLLHANAIKMYNSIKLIRVSSRASCYYHFYELSVMTPRLMAIWLFNYFPDTDTDSRIFSHKNGLLGNGFPAQYPSKFQRDPYMMPQPGQQIMEEPMYREQPQMTRNDWPPQMIQQPQPLVPQVKPQSNSVWPEKLAKETPVDDKATRKKGQNRDSEYSEEYSEGDESQADGDDVTTTEAPKKVSEKFNAVSLKTFNLLCRNFASTRK